MRILHLFDHSIPLHSGYAFRSLQIIKQQRALGWETFHVTSLKHSPSAAAFERVGDFDFYRCSGRHVLGRIPVLDMLEVIAASAKRLRQVAQEVRPDIIHAHSPVLNALAAGPVAKRLRIPMVYEVRAFWEDAAVANDGRSASSPRYALTRYLETRALKRADGVATICEGLRKDIVARGVSPEKIVVIPNAVAADEFPIAGPADPQLRQRAGLENSKVIAFIGSFYPYEGLDDLIQALPRAIKSVPELKLLLVGGGPAEEQLRQLSKKLGLSDRVLFVGRVPHEEVQRYYALADVMVYPRKPIRLTETVTPLKPLEAMAQKKPLIASDVGGHRELIIDGKTGILAPAGDLPGLAKAIADFFEMADGGRAIVEEAYRFVLEERNWARSVSNYAPLFERLTQAAPKR